MYRGYLVTFLPVSSKVFFPFPKSRKKVTNTFNVRNWTQLSRMGNLNDTTTPTLPKAMSFFYEHNIEFAFRNHE